MKKMSTVYKGAVWVALLVLSTGGVMMPVRADESKRIQEVTTSKGIRAWLVESHTLPMISIEVGFMGGSVFEPKGKEGLAQLTAGLLDEGAGPYKAKEFKEELENIGARLGGGADARTLSVHLTTLTEHRNRAFELLGMAVKQPRFDAEDVARIRDVHLAEIRRGDEDPATVAWRVFRPAVYGSHPYANSGEGTLKSVSDLGVKDVAAWHKAQFTKANMVVSVVGDVSPGELADLLDKTLGDLPEGTGRNMVAEGPQPPEQIVKTKKMDVPQGTVLMGHLGLERQDPDFFAMLVMNEILGGGVLTSRLGQDVREKHGLVYDVRTVNSPMPKGGMFYVSLATDNAKVGKALGLVRKHLKQIIEKPVTEQEFEDAKAYLIGSFPLRMDSNNKLLNMLDMMQLDEMGRDYLETWPQRIAAVKREDVQRVARRLIHPDKMVLVVVGNGPALQAK